MKRYVIHLDVTEFDGNNAVTEELIIDTLTDTMMNLVSDGELDDFNGISISEEKR